MAAKNIANRVEIVKERLDETRVELHKELDYVKGELLKFSTLEEGIGSILSNLSILDKIDHLIQPSRVGERHDDEQCLGRDRARFLADSRGEFGRPVGIFRRTDLRHGVFGRAHQPILRGVQEGDGCHNRGVRQDCAPFELGCDDTSRIDSFQDSGVSCSCL
ncbi:hypothetical protein TorRG33x02_227340, partial [Trema orientale]